MPDGSKTDMWLRLKSQSDYYLDRTGRQQYPYINETDSGYLLNLQAEYLKGEDYAILATSKMENLISKLIKALEDTL